MNAAVRMIVLALPLAGLGGLWGLSEYESRQGSEWEVPIEGYDPRDLLRGHYVEFTYDWPGSDEWPDEEYQPVYLCLKGTPPGLPIAEWVEGDLEACEYLAEAEFDSVYGENSLVRGRLYVDQDRALELEEQLLDPQYQGYVRFRLGTNRRVTPLDIRFEPVLVAEATAEAVEESEAE